VEGVGLQGDVQVGPDEDVPTGDPLVEEVVERLQSRLPTSAVRSPRREE
jgi:hypothetical protein